MPPDKNVLGTVTIIQREGMKLRWNSTKSLADTVKAHTEAKLKKIEFWIEAYVQRGKYGVALFKGGMRDRSLESVPLLIGIASGLIDPLSRLPFHS
jgi:hypothetical protein